MKFNEIEFNSITYALDLILKLLVLETNTHSSCVIQNNEFLNSLYLDTPMSIIDCHQLLNNQNLLITQINLGCATFIVTSTCVPIFLRYYREIHSKASSRYLKKYLIIVQDLNDRETQNVTDYFQHPIIFDDIPQTLIISSSNRTVDFWHSANTIQVVYNQYFIDNDTFLYEKPFFPEIKDLTGIELKVATINYPPYTYYEHVIPGTGNANLEMSTEERSVRLDGVELYLCLEFCKKYNCTITLHTEEVELWGDIDQNGNATGLMHAIVSSKSDVTIAAFYHWGSLFPFMQFSDSIQKVRVMHLVPKQKPLPYAMTPLLPFEYEVWLLMIFAYFVSIFAIRLSNRFGIIFTESDKKNEHEFGEIVMMILKLSLFEGTSVINTTSLSEFIIFGVLFYFGMIVGNLYGGALASIMTITRYEKPISTISDISHSNLIWGGPSIVFVLSVYDSQEPTLRYYLDHFQEMSMGDLNKHAEAQDMAIILEALQFGTVCIAEYMDEDVAHNYMLTKNDMYWEQTVMPARKTWPYMELMNRIILMQSESGINSYWEYKATVKTMNYKIQKIIEENGKTVSGSDVPVKLSLSHITGANYLLLIGCGLSFLAFVAEVLWYYKLKEMMLKYFTRD